MPAPFVDFSGGLWIPGNGAGPQPGFAVPNNALLIADNVEFLPAGGLRGRRGRLRRYTLGDPIIGLWRHYPRHGIGNAQAFPSVAASSGSGQPWTPAAPYEAVYSGSGDAFSQFLDLTALRDSDGHALNLAAEDVIAGIEVTVLRRMNTAVSAENSVTDQVVQLLSPSAPPSVSAPHTSWPRNTGFGTAVTYGSPADLWQQPWTAADVNSPSFGVRLQVSFNGPATLPMHALVYAVSVTIYVFTADPPSVIFATSAGGDTVYIITRPPNETLQLIKLLPAGPPPTFVTWPEKGATYIWDGYNEPMEYMHTLTGGGRTMESFATPAGQEIRDPNNVVLGVTVGTPRGPYATLWQNRLWATKPEELGYSVYACEVNEPRRWFGDAQLSVNDPAGGTITGLVGVSGDFSFLLILKDTSLWYFIGDVLTGGQLVRFSDQGCIAPRSVAQVSGTRGVIYHGHGGIYLTDGQTPFPTNIGAALEPLFRPDIDPIVDFPSAVGVYYQSARQYWLKLEPEAADGYICQFLPDGDRMDFGSMRYAWAHVPVLPMFSPNVWSGMPDHGELLMGGLDGYVRQVDIGATDDDGTAEGQPIPVRIQTAAHLIDDGRSNNGAVIPLLREGRVVYVKPTYRGTQPLLGGLRYDVDDAKVVIFAAGVVRAQVSYANARATITEMATFGRVVDVALFNASDGPAFELHRIGLDAQLRTVRQWR